MSYVVFGMRCHEVAASNNFTPSLGGTTDKVLYNLKGLGTTSGESDETTA